MKRILSLICVLSMVLALGGISLASPWNFNLSDLYAVDYSGNTYYLADITFEGLPSDGLESMFLTVGYDNTQLSYVDSVMPDYNDGAFPTPKLLWDGGVFPVTHISNTNINTRIGMVGNINGAAPLPANQGDPIIPFYPVATNDTLMATIYFTPLVDHPTSDSIFFLNGYQYSGGTIPDLIIINGSYFSDEANPDMGIQKLAISGKSVSAVPIPATALLFLSGILGLVGVRRKLRY